MKILDFTGPVIALVFAIDALRSWFFKIPTVNALWLWIAVLWFVLLIEQMLRVRRIRKKRRKADFYDSISKAQEHNPDKIPD